MAVESYNLPSASWRPRRTIGIISVSHHKGLRSRRTDGLGSSLSGGANQCTSYKTVWKEEKTQYPIQRKWILPYFAFCSIQVSNRLYRTYSYWGWQSALLSFPVQFSLLQLLSCVRLLVTPWTATHQASLSITKPWSLPKFVSIESVMPSNHLIVCHPLLLLPSIFCITRVYSNESVLRIRWPKYWSFSFNMSPSKKTQDWFPLGWTGWIPCSPRDSQESSTTPHFKSTNSSALSFLYSPTLTSIHDHWKNNSLD